MRMLFMITENSYIGEIVAKDVRAAIVFESVGIDYCCNGNRTIAQACLDKSLDPQPVIDKLLEIDSKSSPLSDKDDYNTWSLDQLVDHIEQRHHKYVVREIPLLIQRLDRVCQVHGSRHPELLEINELFSVSAKEFLQHMQKEESMLFPYIKNLVATSDKNEHVTKPSFGSVSAPIAMMMEEHSSEGERFEAIANLTDDYTPPADACTTYRVTFETLKAFEQDLHIHIHLENNILFPKAIELEDRLAV